ncbi:MAG: hypothetical protein KIT00_08080 [Rhodospirillales bacterium]|nr:hypothetical protein [Rhodospirillales bacterium]
MEGANRGPEQPELPLPAPPLPPDMPPLPASMVNEYQYCPRLAYLQWVQGEWADTADTLDGRFKHRRVDRASGTLPTADDLGEDERLHVRSLTLASVQPVLVGAAWSGAVDLVAKVARPATSVAVPAMTGTYLIKAVDLGGRESEHAALIVTSATAVLGRNVVETITEHPAFAGDLENCAVANDRLKLAGADTLGDWPQLSDIDAIGFGIAGIAPEGTYTFTGVLDLGAVYTSRLTAVLKVSGENVANIVKAWSELKTVERLSGTEPGQYDAWLEVRTTNNDPAGTPVWSDWRPFVIGDTTARAFQWRAQLRSFNPAVTPLVDALSVTVDMPDRVDGANDIACPAEGLTVTFTPAFRATPAIAVSGQAMATGDVFEITGQSPMGFTVTFKNSAGAGVARTFDWVARGYGYQQAA